MLYDGTMGYSTSIDREAGSERWVVAARVNLSRAESNQLFLSGDSMVSWPAEGLESEDSKLERSSMFVSEIAARPDGLVIRYREQAQAARAATVLRMQFGQIGIQEEA